MDDVILAIALAASEDDHRLAERIETRVRMLLIQRANSGEGICETFAWLERFETGRGHPDT